MKNLFLLSLIMTLLFYCNEKVADDLIDYGSSSSVEDTDVSDPSTQDMRVVSKMDSSLSFIMHKMGSIDTACSLAPPLTGLSAEDYTKADTTRNVDCVLDAQEIDIHENGATFELQIDNKMCEYIEYQPYRFFKSQPGVTNRKVFKVACDAACSEAMPTECDRYYDETTAVTNGNYSAALFSTDVTMAYADKSMCTFDYGGYNCDEGSVSADTYIVSGYYAERCSDPVELNEADCVAADEEWITGDYCGAPGDPVGTVTYARSSDDDEVTSCEGEFEACLDGAGIEQLKDFEPLEILNSSEVSDYTKEFSATSPKELGRSSNRYIANFSRVCSDTSTNKSSDNIFETITFNGSENEKISYTYTDSDIDVNSDGIIDGTTYADHPFSGSIYGSSLDAIRYSTSPYYAIRCLDSARDVKAQIRLYIREWDRKFDDDYIYLARVSDKAIEGSGISLMDNNGFYDSDIAWNDFNDWDDFLDLSGNPVFVDNQCSVLTNTPSLDPAHGVGNFPGDE
jgi:hypothetical protein